MTLEWMKQGMHTFALGVVAEWSKVLVAWPLMVRSTLSVYKIYIMHMKQTSGH